LLARHSERYRRYAIGLHDSGREVHTEHRQILELAMSGQEARATRARSPHSRYAGLASARVVARTPSSKLKRPEG